MTLYYIILYYIILYWIRLDQIRFYYIKKTYKLLNKTNINKVNKVDVCTIIEKCSIDEISKYLIKLGKKRDFPDITSRE